MNIVLDSFSECIKSSTGYQLSRDDLLGIRLKTDSIKIVGFEFCGKPTVVAVANNSVYAMNGIAKHFMSETGWLNFDDLVIWGNKKDSRAVNYLIAIGLSMIEKPFKD